METELLQHASTIELRVHPRQAPFPVAKAIDIIRKLAGVLEEEDVAVVSGLLERQGGRFSLTAEIGGPHRFSIEVPLSPAQPARASTGEPS